MATRTVNSVINPRWADFSNTMIDMDVDFDELDDEYVPFTANQNDPEPYGVDLYNRAVSGEFGAIAPYQKPDNITGSAAMDALRVERNRLLDSSDYIEMPTKWATLSASEQTAWATYRNALRDLPATYPNAELHYADNGESTSWVNVTWPTKPE